MCLLSSFQVLLSLVIITLFVIYSLRKKWRNRRKQQENDSTSNKYKENSSVSGDMNLSENKDNGQEPKMNLSSMSFLPFIWNIVFCQRNKQYHNLHINILVSNTLSGLSLVFPNDKVVCMNIFEYKLIHFLHPESSKEVLRSNGLINKDSFYYFFKPTLGLNSILYSPDDNWRRRRKYLAPHFHLRNVKDDQNVFMEHSNVLVEKLKQLQENEIFDVLKWMKNCTLDIIADIAVGVSLHSQTNDNQEYVSAMH
ncbi:cytochrome P450 4V2-like, partial [Centruroides sculpturatus]|uniref:cytochrome P450 4V2-like n=1 Tax=Centruroides sculpturatus TaxID=218467 RepID=UPI000C6C9260